MKSYHNFTTQTGIQVVADVYDRMRQCWLAGGGTYSVIYPSDYMVRRMVELDLLSQLEQARLSSLNNLFPRFQNLTMI